VFANGDMKMAAITNPAHAAAAREAGAIPSAMRSREMTFGGSDV